jgi:hypothetical protein
VRSFLEVDVDLRFGDADRPSGLDDLPAQPLGLRFGEGAIAPVPRISAEIEGSGPEM